MPRRVILFAPLVNFAGFRAGRKCGRPTTYPRLSRAQADGFFGVRVLFCASAFLRISLAAWISLEHLFLPSFGGAKVSMVEPNVMDFMNTNIFVE